MEKEFVTIIILPAVHIANACISIFNDVVQNQFPIVSTPKSNGRIYYYITTFVANSQGSSFMYYAFYLPSFYPLRLPHPMHLPWNSMTLLLPEAQFVTQTRVNFHRRRFVAMQAPAAICRKIWIGFLIPLIL